MRDRCIVETASGRLRGCETDGVIQFRAVPYGQTTAGAHRFQPPRPVLPCAGLRDATQPGASAPQLLCPENIDPFYAWYSAIRPPSEDCLHLDVCTPGTAGARPVMVWLHGGGWTQFSGTAPGLDGRALARAEDVVVVSVSHRLGLFGYLDFGHEHGAFEASGVAGLLDLVMALQWIRDNVAAFGGAPDNVTIFGHSGGGSKVAALMAMPQARGLFHRAIIQSTGSGTHLATRDEAGAVRAAVAQSLGVSQLCPVTLQALPMAQLLAVAAKVPPPRPVIDGVHVAGHPYAGRDPDRAFACPGSAQPSLADVPLMIGCTPTECSYYMRPLAGREAPRRRGAADRLAAFLSVSQAEAAGVLDWFRARFPTADEAELLNRAASQQMFTRPARQIAARQAAQARSPVYLYRFDWQSGVEGGRLLSPHGCELPFIFGTTRIARACVGDASASLEALMMRAWGGFARTGQPGHDPKTGGAWRPHAAHDPCVMSLGAGDTPVPMPADPICPAIANLPCYSYGHSMAPLWDGFRLA